MQSVNCMPIVGRKPDNSEPIQGSDCYSDKVLRVLVNPGNILSVCARIVLLFFVCSTTIVYNDSTHVNKSSIYPHGFEYCSMLHSILYPVTPICLHIFILCNKRQILRQLGGSNYWW